MKHRTMRDTVDIKSDSLLAEFAENPNQENEVAKLTKPPRKRLEVEKDGRIIEGENIEISQKPPVLENLNRRVMKMNETEVNRNETVDKDNSKTKKLLKVVKNDKNKGGSDLAVVEDAKKKVKETVKELIDVQKEQPSKLSSSKVKDAVDSGAKDAVVDEAVEKAVEDSNKAISNIVGNKTVVAANVTAAVSEAVRKAVTGALQSALPVASEMTKAAAEQLSDSSSSSGHEDTGPIQALGLNTTTAISEQVAVVTGVNGEQSLKIIGPIFTARPYEPAGWREIFAVLGFSLCIFLPVAFVVLSGYVKKKVDQLPTVNERAIGVCTTIKKIGQKAFRNLVILKTQRYEDVVKLGPEAALYLSIHRETTRLLFFMSVLACSIILPVHLSKGTVEVSEFSKSTIQHLSKHDSALWLHTIFVFIFTYIGIRYIHICRDHLIWTWNEGVERAAPGDLWDGSIFIKRGLPKNVTEDELRDALEFLCPGEVLDVFMISDPRKSENARTRLMAAEDELLAIREHGYYLESNHKEIEKLEAEIKLLKEKEEEVSGTTTDKALVTFANSGLARLFVVPKERHRAVQRTCAKQFKTMSSRSLLDTYLEHPEAGSDSNIAAGNHFNDNEQNKVSDNSYLQNGLMAINAVDMAEWHVENAPDPHDVVWESLHLESTVWLLRTVVVNLVIFATLVTLTTPVSLLTYISGIASAEEEASLKSSYVSAVQRFSQVYPATGDFFLHFMPQLALVFVNALLLFFIFILAKYWEPHITYSSQEISVFRKSFWFLLFNTLLLPSLAFQSLGSLVGHLIEDELSPFSMLGKVFVVSSGAFTLCYIITQTWVGAAFDFLRLTDRLWRCTVVSCWFRRSKRKSSSREKSDFDFGSEYSTMLVILSLCFTFSTAVPVILPFGLCYFLVKGMVDHYQLHYICGNLKVHRSPRCRVGQVAVSYLFVPLLLFQASTLGFLSNYVCTSKINAITPGTLPHGCVIEGTQTPGTLSMRGKTVQLFLLFGLLVLTAAHGLYTFMTDYANKTVGQPPLHQKNIRYWFRFRNLSRKQSSSTLSEKFSPNKTNHDSGDVHKETKENEQTISASSSSSPSHLKTRHSFKSNDVEDYEHSENDSLLG